MYHEKRHFRGEKEILMLLRIKNDAKKIVTIGMATWHSLFGKVPIGSDLPSASYQIQCSRRQV